MLDRLHEQPDPLSLASLVRATGLHENTLREHLTALVRRGLVRRFRAEPSGRGRPAWLYELTDHQPATSEYAGLASALAATITRTSDDPPAVAATAGEEWGRELARDRGATQMPAQEARAEVVQLLDDLGFAPGFARDAPSEVRLTRCPLLEAAHRFPDVVCAVHLGIVRGALTEYGGVADDADLLPFAEPGACVLTLPLPLSGPTPASAGQRRG